MMQFSNLVRKLKKPTIRIVKNIQEQNDALCNEYSSIFSQCRCKVIQEINAFFKQFGVPEVCILWLNDGSDNNSTWEQLSFLALGTFYSIQVVFGNKDNEIIIRKKGLEDQLRECSNTGKIACICPISSIDFKPLYGKNLLLTSEDFSPFSLDYSNLSDENMTQRIVTQAMINFAQIALSRSDAAIIWGASSSSRIYFNTKKRKKNILLLKVDKEDCPSIPDICEILELREQPGEVAIFSLSNSLDTIEENKLHTALNTPTGSVCITLNGIISFQDYMMRQGKIMRQVSKFNLSKTMTKNKIQPSTCPIDMGLPSGNLWGDRNLCATGPMDIGQTTDFDKQEFEHYFGLIKRTLGQEWKIPDQRDWAELAFFSDIQHDEKGVTFTSKLNGNSIIIPISKQGGTYWADEEFMGQFDICRIDIECFDDYENLPIRCIKMAQ